MLGGGQSAVTSVTLLLPTSSWGTNYIRSLCWLAASRSSLMVDAVLPAGF